MPDPVPHSPPPSASPQDDTSVRNAGDTSGEHHTVSQTVNPQFAFLGPAAVAGHLGTLGKYRVVEKLGEGGMGYVFRGEDPKLSRAVALKVMRPDFLARPLALDRFLRESRSAAAVTHPHVVIIFDFGEHNGLPFLAMELLAGDTLEGWLRENGGTAQPDAAIRIAKDTLAGLAAVHAHGLVHRDVKPSNLWVDPHGRVKVLDFGLTRGTDSSISADGAVVGTPAYMSPEQAGGKPVDARSDLFSVGTVLYRTLTGGNPFTRPETLATLLAVATDEPVALVNAAPWVPERLARFVHRLLCKNPKGRFADAREALTELEQIEERLNAAEVAPAVAPPAADTLPPCPRLIGRDNLLSLIGAQLKAGGVVILRGEGGMGKTTLAAAAAHAARGPGGAAWVNCERTPRFEECARQAAAALLGDRCESEPLDAVAQKVAAHLTAKGGLLVLDNFESVGGDAAFARWVSGLRGPAQALVTTREIPVGLHGRVLPVHELSRADAADLFRARAAEAGLPAPPPPEVVDALCERVGDQPLAIELLAVRAARTPAQRLLDRVRKNLAVIDAEDDPSRPARHRGVRACFADSFADLSPTARELLLNLSVLPASFGLDLLSAVAARDDWDDAADELVDASLWRLSAERYAVHPLVRQLASDELGPNREQAERAAAQRVAAAATAQRNDLRAAGNDRERTKKYLNWCGAELPNLIAVADASFIRGDWAVVTALGQALSAFWSARGYWDVADRVYAQATAAAVSAGDPVAEAWSREYQGFIWRHVGRYSESEAAYRSALAVCDAHPAAAAAHRGRILARFGKLLSVMGRYSDSIDTLDQALEFFTVGGNSDGISMVSTYLGQVHKFVGDLPRAEEQFLWVLEWARRKRDGHRECEALFQLGGTYISMGRLDDADRHLRESMRLAKLADDRIRESQALAGLGIAATRRGAFADAEKLLDAALQITRDLNLKLYEGRTLRRIAELWEARGRLDRAREFARSAVAVLELTEDKVSQNHARDRLRAIEDAIAGRPPTVGPPRDDTR
jgi:tetratricopeptide (TPR) repeat protein/tRNA A-37 threonylcarbamoyl transferase component Bud32